MQAGDDAVLKRMARGYTVCPFTASWSAKSARKSHMPALPRILSLAFPARRRSNSRIRSTWCASCALTRCTSPPIRPVRGTPAHRLPDDAPAEDKELRRRAVEEAQTQIAAEINARLVGETLGKFSSKAARRGVGAGGTRTRTNRLVHFADEQDRRGQLVAVRIHLGRPLVAFGRRSQKRRAMNCRHVPLVGRYAGAGDPPPKRAQEIAG